MLKELNEEPLLKFESDATAPILRYNLPSPSSYEGKVYIEIDLDSGIFKHEAAHKIPSYYDILNSNREEIQEYLINSRKEDLERELTPFITIEEFTNEITEQEKKQIILEYIKTQNTQFIDLLNLIEEEFDENGNVINYALEAKNKLFTFYVQAALHIEHKILTFYRTMGGNLKIKFVDVPPKPEPRLFFVETYKLTNLPGDYGAGTILKTFSLLPREMTEISIKTWKKTSLEMKKASSILDSYTTEKADEFESSIQAESASSSRAETSLSYNIEASASANWGFGRASVTGKLGGSVKSVREESTKNVMNATAKHAQNASAKREVNIDTSFEKSVETGIETAIMRKIRNLNVTRTLNFTFRQMNQQFHSILHLTDLRIAFYNGYPGSYREYALNDLGHLVNKYFKKYKIHYNLLRNIILKEYGRIYDDQGKPIDMQGHVFDYQGNPRALVEEINLPDENISYLRVIPPLNGKGEPLGQQNYVMRQKTEDQPEDIRYLNGVILVREVITMKTDGIIVEALMGRANALDDYSYDYRVEKILKKRYENDRIKLGLKLVKQLIKEGQYDQAIKSYRETFGVEPGLEVIKELFKTPKSE